MGITFDWNISLGSIVSLATLLTVFLRAHVTNIKRIQKIETQVELLYSWFNEHVIKRSDD